MTYSTLHSDAQFLSICLLAIWMLVRLVLAILGPLPWSGWILVAGFFISWAFFAWGNLEDAIS